MKSVIIIENDDQYAMCLQGWLFGTDYEVYCVINNLQMANKVLNNYVPDIIILDASMLQKTEEYILDLSVIKPQNILLMVGSEWQPTPSNKAYNKIIEPFDRMELLRSLDEIQTTVKLVLKSTLNLS